MKISTRTLSFIVMALLFATSARAALECPIFTLGETTEDCPWADVTRELSQTRHATAVLAKLPGILKQLDRDRSQDLLKSLWGESINYDEGAKAIIVQPQVIDALIEKMGVAPRKDKIVHAGVEHTYGYLFSNLKTPYGYKRARWVRKDIEAGFKLPRGTLSPYAKDGSFFANVTVFISQIAFRSEPDLAKDILTKSTGIASAVINFDYKKLEIKRIEETFELGPRKIILRTDLVPFPVKGAPTDKSHLLVYSVSDSKHDSKKSVTQIITAFPVNQSFVDHSLKPEEFGKDRPITTRYNANVEGLTGILPSPHGTRELK